MLHQYTVDLARLYVVALWFGLWHQEGLPTTHADYAVAEDAHTQSFPDRSELGAARTGGCDDDGIQDIRNN